MPRSRSSSPHTRLPPHPRRPSHHPSPTASRLQQQARKTLTTMPVTARSRHGHTAIFRAEGAHPRDLSTVSWTSHSIYVPSSSSLNGTADVWLHVSTTPARAARWCASRGVQFLGMRDHATFGFRVSCFSRYRYVDSDDDEDTPRRARPRPRTVVANIDDEPDHPADALSTHQITHPHPHPFSPSAKSFQYNYDGPRVTDEQAVYRLRSALFDQKPAVEVRDVDMMEAFASDEDRLPDDPVTDPDPDVEEEEGRAREVEFGDVPARRHALPVLQLPFPVLPNSVMAGHEGVWLDTGLMLGRTTRVSFAGGVLASSKYKTHRNPFSQTGFGVQISSVHKGIGDAIAGLLRVHCTAWNLSAEACDGVRVPTLADAFEDSAVANEILDTFVEELRKAADAGDGDARHARVVFALALALYKDTESAHLESDCLMRRLAIWADGDAGSVFDERVHSTELRKALLELCVGRVEESTNVAVEAGYVRLAMLISRALENPKEDLRLDAEAQLAVYGLVTIDELDDPDRNPDRWDKILEDATPDSKVSVDERMILLVLAGHVGAVARYMQFSWYRLFILELLHGAGSSDLTQPERVAAAVHAIADSGIETTPPHAATNDSDAAYHLLRLYADDTSTYPLTSGVYSNSSFGMRHDALDSRFSWLLHQTLSALIPEAGTKSAHITLSDGLSTQLNDAGMPLWAFYVVCSGGAPPQLLKNWLIQNWPQMREDRVKLSDGLLDSLRSISRMESAAEMVPEMGNSNEDAESAAAEGFLEEILGVPKQWIYEAKAVEARISGDGLEECRCWIGCGTEEGAMNAHDLLSQKLVPEMVVAQESERYGVVTELLTKLGNLKHVSNWHAAGDVMLCYMRNIVGVPTQSMPTAATLRSMVPRVACLMERADSCIQEHAARVMADGVATAQRALLIKAGTEGREELLRQLEEDLRGLPCSSGAKARIEGEYEAERKRGRAAAARFSGALPAYNRFTQVVE